MLVLIALNNMSVKQQVYYTTLYLQVDQKVTVTYSTTSIRLTHSSVMQNCTVMSDIVIQTSYKNGNSEQWSSKCWNG
jgi:hypothetical protein